MTLKLLLDWAQIIYSMKNIKIYPKDWLQLHPYKQSDPTDSYYTNIANRIYGMLEETRLAYSFEKDEVKQISIRMAAYFEDVISGLNIWRSFITEHKALYGKFLPFYTPDDHYYDDEVNYEDIRFLLWHYTQQYHGFHKGTFVSPDNAANGDTAKLIYQMSVSYTRCSVTNGQLHRRTNGCNSSLPRKPAMRMSTNITSCFTGSITNVTCLPIHTRN